MVNTKTKEVRMVNTDKKNNFLDAIYEYGLCNTYKILNLYKF